MKQSGPSKRVFVGIKATDRVSDECIKLQAGLSNLPVGLTHPEDLHLTLLPPWQMEDQLLTEKKLLKAVRSIESFTLEFKTLAFGPDNNRPRLVWITGKATNEINRLKQALEDVLGIETRLPVLPHITIARFARKDQARLACQTLKQPISLSMPVTSVELFESAKSNGNAYRVLLSLPLLPSPDNGW